MMIWRLELGFRGMCSPESEELGGQMIYTPKPATRVASNPEQFCTPRYVSLLGISGRVAAVKGSG